MDRRLIGAVIGLVFGASPAAAQQFQEPLPIEDIPAAVQEFPTNYPVGWVFLHDLFFDSLLDGRVGIVDPMDTRRPLKGQIRAAQFATFLAGTKRAELYTAETFYSRLTRGDRTDAITVWDKATLEHKGEILLPGGKRGQAVTQPGTFQFTDDERMALVWNFTPASSVTVVDLADRKVLNEVETPGCSLTYPTGQRGFFTLCNDGGLTNFVLNADGSVARQEPSSPFNQIDDDPMFMIFAKVGSTYYFPTFQGRMQPIDAAGDTAQPQTAWSLVSQTEVAEGWRPAGWQVISSDATGRLYVLMQKGGKEGSHKDGGTEVWVFDPASKSRAQRIILDKLAISIEVAGGDKPHLVAFAAAGGLDVYDASTGAFRHSLSATVSHHPMVITAAR